MDDYHCAGRIGRGSYGEVWLVRCKKDRKQYVLKQINLQRASKRELRAANLEAQLLATLRHPNIVSYRDAFESHEGFLYIVMGYCEGGDLYTQIKLQKGVPFEESRIVEWFIQISMALQYLHERNILHRDLKTQNIFLTKSKIIKVGDLGIAKVLDCDSAMATTLIGTPYYMSPELFSNRPYNHKSDVWALGCCIYEIATLRHAFNARDMNSLMYKIIRGKLPAMPGIYTSELQDLIRSLLSHNPDKRPSASRILRHPYIKRNIAIFLEGTKLRQNTPTAPEKSVIYSINLSKPEKPNFNRDSDVPIKAANPDLSVQGTGLSKEANLVSDVVPKPPSNGSDPVSHECNKNPVQVATPVPNLFIDGQEIKLEDRFERRNSDGSSGSGRSTNSAKQKMSTESRESPKRSVGTSRNGAGERERKITPTKRPKDVTAKSAPVVNGQDVLPDVSQIRRPNKEARQRRRQKLMAQNAHQVANRIVTRPLVSGSGTVPDACGEQGTSPPGSLSTNSNSDGDYDNLIDLLSTTLKVDPESPPCSTTLPSERKRTLPEKTSETERSASRLELRIHALENDCLHGLGTSLLERAMDAIMKKDTKELQDELLDILGEKNYNDFVGKLWQLKLCHECIKPEDL